MKDLSNLSSILEADSAKGKEKMTRNETIQELIKNCPDFTVEKLNALTIDQLDEIGATDLNWCYNWNTPEHYGSFSSEQDAIWMGLYATYEDILAGKR